jgi:Icc-related predicted phosphoesterase
MKMKIIAISDLHGDLPEITETFDLLCIAGDICPVTDHSYSFQKEWIKDVFIPWINNLPYRTPYAKVILVAGNHDFYLEQAGQNITTLKWDFKYGTNGRCIYLQHDSYTFDYLDEDSNTVRKIEIFGTPYTHFCGLWAFMKYDDELANKFSDIPEGLDILITHDAPNLNGCGEINHGLPWYKNVGCKPLANAILEKRPKYCFCGHIHTGNHELSQVNNEDIWTCNVSIKNEYYDAVFKPFVLEI